MHVRVTFPFLAPLLVNVLSELFKLWIKRQPLLEGVAKPHRWHGGAFVALLDNYHHYKPILTHPSDFQAFVLIFLRVCLWFESTLLKLAHALLASILQQRNQLFSRVSALIFVFCAKIDL